ncbi:MAG: histidinol-phosphatase [Oscillospiraceae bacterium]|nr:histidinol-phosphatase [Oscillospiraceae bacterium]
MVYNNYHTHTIFCDGENSVEDMIIAAIELGCPELGFSGHSFLSIDPDWTMTKEQSKQYRKTVLEMKKKYESKINVRLGIEQDYFSDTEELELYEYVIGAVHCIIKDGVYVSVDASKELQEDAINKVYNGDKMAFVEDYFNLVSKVYDKTKCNIIAHFDLLNKFGLFDQNDERYIHAENMALEALIETPSFFELNTGGIARGYTTEPYPNERVLKILGMSQKPVILSSDTHSKDTITFGFDNMLKLVEKYNLKLIDKI